MLYVLVGVVLLMLIIVIQTIRFKTVENSYEIRKIDIDYDKLSGVRKLSEAIKVKTISRDDYSKVDWNEFEKYHQKIEELFPLVHKILKKEIINNYSLLYQWKGKDSNKKPILITAHMDVVPIEKGTEGDWKYPPFSGAVEEGYVWGRGALDTKVHMISALEAVEILLKDDYVPDRDIYFAFGHDEEVGGKQGALQIVKYLKDKGLEFEYLIDEGGCVTEGTISEIHKPLALVGIGEKGFANIKITVTGEGGHASMPPTHSALGLLAKILTKLERKQCSLKITKPIKEFLMKIGPEMKFVNRIILANLWLFKPLFIWIFSKTKSGNAMLRTTTAVTMADASVAPNVLPQQANAVINFRIRPGESGEDLIKHIKQVNSNIPLQIEALRLEDPSKISSSQSEGFRKIEAITQLLYKDVIVAPYIVLAGTDARKYEPICENIYRFTPYKLTNEELDTIHSTNESISITSINKCIEFFYLLFKQC